MDTIEAIRGRRTVRDYDSRRPARELIEDILWDAAQAPVPPASGHEPFVFIVVEGADQVASFGETALRHAKAHRPPGPGYDWVEKPGFTVFFNAPAIVVICGAVGGAAEGLADCARAGQNLMLAAHARGLATCWVGSAMLWIESAEARAELAIPESHAPFAVFTLGYARGEPKGKPRQRPKVIWL
jgi:nitroreductase